MKPVVVRHISRADAAVVQRLVAPGVSTVHKAHGRTGLMMRFPVWSGATKQVCLG